MARKPLDYLPRFSTGKAAGQLRHRITIQQMTEVLDTARQPIPTWSDLDTVWGLFEQTGGFEASGSGEQVRSIITGIVTIRGYPGLTPKMRLKVSGYQVTDLIVNIGSVPFPDPSTGMQVLMVKQPEEGVVL